MNIRSDLATLFRCLVVLPVSGLMYAVVFLLTGFFFVLQSGCYLVGMLGEGALHTIIILSRTAAAIAGEPWAFECDVEESQE